ncbi:serine hydrolase domain-containing protein [Nonomuraea sp. NPDC050328]|uniref:serine hydrolase domain-containing protein n=1 Tax=Nonomuraea sp. NPDC050328 TaxID=3364361 RepID=UPI00379F2B07
MRRVLSTLLAVACMATLTAGPVQAAETGFDCLLAQAAKPPVPGVILQVRGPRGDYTGATGKFALNGRDLRPTDAFRAASVSKTFTAVAVLKLAERGKLRLDQRVQQYLDPKLVTRLTRSYSPKITIRQLLDHTAGLYDYATDPDWQAAVGSHARRTWTAGQLVGWALDHGKPYFPAGKGYHYSDTGYVLAAKVIEKVTGQRLAQAYRTLILDPLKLEHTYLEGQDRPRVAKPVAHAYRGTVDTRGWNPSFDTHGGGGLVTTAGDLTAFVRALFEGKVFTKPGTLRTMLTPTPQSGEEAYGLGIQRLGSGKTALWYHPGFWGTIMGYSPGTKVSLVTTVNQADDQGLLSALVQKAYTLAVTGTDSCRR